MIKKNVKSMAGRRQMSSSALLSVLLCLGLSACAGGGQLPSDNRGGDKHSDMGPSSGDRFDHIIERKARNNLKYSAYLKAAMARDKEMPSLAAHYFEEALKDSPGSEFLKENSFAQHVIAGQLDKAAPLAEELSKSSQDDMVHLISIVRHFKKGDAKAALAGLDQAPKANFNFIIHPILRSWAHALLGEKAKAYEQMDAMARSAQLTDLAVEYKAYIADYLNDTAEAEKNYKLVIDNDKSASLQATVGYMSFLARNDRVSEVKDVVKKALKAYPRSQYLISNARSIVAGNMTVPSFATPLGNIENLFEVLARDLTDRYKLLAMNYYDMAFYVSGNRPDIKLKQANLLMSMDKFDLAAERFASMPTFGRYAAVAMLGQIRAHLAAGNKETALTLMKKVEREDPNNETIISLLADFYRTERKFDQALIYLERLVSKIKKPSADDWYVYFAVGVCYEQLGQWQKAEENLLFALKLSPEQPDLLNYIGYSWIDRSVNQDQAKDYIEKAAKLSPNNGYILDSLGWVYYLLGDFDRAVKTLEKAVLLETGDAVLHDHLGDAYWRVNRKREGRFQWQQALAYEPDEELKKSLIVKLKTGLAEHK